MDLAFEWAERLGPLLDGALPRGAVLAVSVTVMRHRRTVLVIGCVMAGAACGAPNDRANEVVRDPLPRTITSTAMGRGGGRRGGATTATAPVTTVPVTEVAVEDVSAALVRLRGAYVACLTWPDGCAVDAIAVPSSRAGRRLARDVEDFRRWNLGRAPDVPGDRVVVRRAERSGADRAAAELCIADDMPLVDRGPSDSASDDIPYTNPPLSVLQRWSLSAASGVWRLADVETLGYFPGSTVCEPPHE